MCLQNYLKEAIDGIFIYIEVHFSDIFFVVARLTKLADFQTSLFSKLFALINIFQLETFESFLVLKKK